MQQGAVPVSPVKEGPSKESFAKEAAWRSWKPKEFVGDIKEELKKINWTSPAELRTYTKIVVASTFIAGMGIYFIDLIIQVSLNGLALIARLIAG